jgi:putative membrane protein
MTTTATHERSRYLDGLWHRLHPATPLLRGGIGLVAVLF